MVYNLVTSADSAVTIITLNSLGKILTSIAKYFPDSQISLDANRHCWFCALLIFTAP